MIDLMLEEIGKKYKLTRIETGEFSKVKASGMKFQISAYKAEGLGNVSMMTATGFFGLMKMDTLIVNPFEKDAPLFSYDRIYALTRDTLLLELYDTRLEKGPMTEVKKIVEIGKILPDGDPGVHWYDNIKLNESVKKVGRKDLSTIFDKMSEDYIVNYLKDVAKTADCDRQRKIKAAAAYTEGLLTNGGPSTNAFLKSFGVEKTGKLFRDILFGTGKVTNEKIDEEET